jgi:hypothetical protein
MTAHPHAENMRLYAEDAAETDKPWERWEGRTEDGPWTPLGGHPMWDWGNVPAQFRRKPKPLEFWVAEYENGYRQTFFARPDSITESVDCRLVRVIHMREVTE